MRGIFHWEIIIFLVVKNFGRLQILRKSRYDNCCYVRADKTEDVFLSTGNRWVCPTARSVPQFWLDSVEMYWERSEFDCERCLVSFGKEKARTFAFKFIFCGTCVYLIFIVWDQAYLTLIVLMWRIGWAHKNARK